MGELQKIVHSRRRLTQQNKTRGMLLFPSSRGGVDATSLKYRRRHPLIGADGVVRNISDHLVCASKVASQLFLDRAATPPLEEGNSSRFTIPLTVKS